MNDNQRNVVTKRMRAVRRRDTQQELIVRSVAHRMGLRFRTCVKTLPGSPDLVFSRHLVCIFVHGCFWHRHDGCSKASTPKSNQNFWTDKFAANIARDLAKSAKLTALGWRVAAIWQCETEDVAVLQKKLSKIFGVRRASHSRAIATKRQRTQL